MAPSCCILSKCNDVMEFIVWCDDLLFEGLLIGNPAKAVAFNAVEHIKAGFLRPLRNPEAKEGYGLAHRCRREVGRN